MDLTVNYSEEEKALFEEVHQIEQEIRRLENEAYSYRHEKENHYRVSSTNLVPTIIFCALFVFNILLLVLDIVIGLGTFTHVKESLLGQKLMLQLSISMAVVVGTPIAIVFFGIMSVINIRKLILQTSKNTRVIARAKKLGIENFYNEKDRMEGSYDSAEHKLAILRQRYREKKQELDAMTMAMEAKRREEQQKAWSQGATFEVVKHERKL